MTEREPLPRTVDEITEDERFNRWYGRWSPLSPSQSVDFFDGFQRPWWIVGGWAIEAFTGVPRDHEDLDCSLLSRDAPALRAHLGDRWCLWHNHGGTLRPFDDQHPELDDPAVQLWVRRSAADPWVMDIPLTPDRDGLWTNKRLPGHVAPLDEVTWIAADGVRYLNPEICLLFKARQRRAKDHRDFAVTLPLLSTGKQRWLRDRVSELFPGHPWLSDLR